MLEHEVKTEQVGTDRLGDVIAGRYRLEGVLGHGGAGVVFEAVHVLTERRVAVKLVDTSKASEANVTRLLKEARAAVRLSHQNVVEVLDMGQLENGSVYLALELLRGQSLANRLKGRQRLELEEALAILDPIMAAVASAHDIGLIHRDLKPGNIFLHQDGGRTIPKLLDFGVVKETDPDAVRQTQAGIVLGTPHFMSPEQARGLPDIGPPVDVWAMGVVLYRTLTGFLPFRGKNVPLVLREITRGVFIPLWEHVPSLPGPVVRVIEDALVCDPNVRFQTMGQFLEALRAAKDGVVVQHVARPPPGTETLDLAAKRLGANHAPFEPDDVTPLPSNESLDLPEYRAALRSPAGVDGRAVSSLVAPARSRRAVPWLLTGLFLAAAAAGAFYYRNVLLAPEVAPIVDRSASTVARIEVPDEAPKRVFEAEKAPPPPVEAPAREPEPEPEPTPVVPPDTAVRDAAIAARASAMDVREALATALAALVENERRATRTMSSTQQMKQRAHEPADRRMSRSAHQAAVRGFEAAVAATQKCRRERSKMARGRSLEQRWAEAEALHRAGDYAKSRKAFDEIAQIGARVQPACGGVPTRSPVTAQATVRTPDAAPQGTVVATRVIKAEASPVAAEPEDRKVRARKLYERALSKKRAGDKKGAIKALTEAIEAAPEFVSAYNSRGLLEQSIGQVDRAIADFDRAHALDSKNAGVLNNRGYAKLARHDLTGALQDFDAAIQRDKSNASFYENRGAARYLTGKFDEAAEDFGRAIEIAPKQTSAYRRRAMTRQKIGDHAGARADLDRVVAVKPNDVEVRYARGRSFFELGQFDAAVSDFDRVIELAPRRSDAYLRRGLSYVKKGNGPAAKRDLEKHLELSPDSRHKRIVERHLDAIRG